MLRWVGCAQNAFRVGAGTAVWQRGSLALLKPALPACGLAAQLVDRRAAYHSSPVAKADILGSVLDEVTKGEGKDAKEEDPLDHIAGGTSHKVSAPSSLFPQRLAVADPRKRSRILPLQSGETKRAAQPSTSGF